MRIVRSTCESVGRWGAGDFNAVLVHFGVTEHPTEEWTMQQMREAFPWDQAPRYLLRDRDAIYGRDFDCASRKSRNV
jgi:hypothetical protein